MSEPTTNPTPEAPPARCSFCLALPAEGHTEDCPVRTRAERRERARLRRKRMAAECVTLRLPEGSLERLDVIAERQGALPSEWLRKIVLAAIQRAEAGSTRKKAATS